MHPTPTLPAAHPLIFVRHGATEPNLAGLRCGGDLDVPLTELGRRQAAETGQRLRELEVPVGVIVSSDLQRTRETAQLIALALPGVQVVIEPGFAERHLGGWNLQPIADTEAALASGATPPGGESNEAFMGRIAQAAQALLPRMNQRPLLVASKGVARALGELLGHPARHGLGNGELAHFNLAAMRRRHPAECPT